MTGPLKVVVFYSDVRGDYFCRYRENGGILTTTVLHNALWFDPESRIDLVEKRISIKTSYDYKPIIHEIL